MARRTSSNSKTPKLFSSTRNPRSRKKKPNDQEKSCFFVLMSRNKQTKISTIHIFLKNIKGCSIPYALVVWLIVKSDVFFWWPILIAAASNRPYLRIPKRPLNRLLLTLRGLLFNLIFRVPTEVLHHLRRQLPSSARQFVPVPILSNEKVAFSKSLLLGFRF